MIVSLSNKLEAIAETVLSKCKSNFYLCDCTFYSPLDSSLKVIPDKFNFLDIDQLFTINYMDDIALNCTLPIADAIKLLKNYKDLRCVIVLNRATFSPSQPLPGELPIKLTFRVIINNADDLFKKFQKNELMATEDNVIMDIQDGRTSTLECQLFEDTAYELRHAQINGLLRNTTIENAIYYVTNLLGIKNKSIVKPTNSRQYEHLSLPPMLSISNVFDFLQSRYGIYSKGLGVYYTDKKLYLFPKAETAPQTDTVVNFYKLPVNQYLGHHAYHYFDDHKNLHILVNSEIETKAISIHGAENEGNYKVALRTDMALDCTRDIQGTKGQYQKQNTLSCGLKSDRTATSGAKNARYTTSTNNAFQMASDMADKDCEIVAFTWILAEPFAIYPGQKVIYNYEDISEYRIRTGVIDTVKYSLHQIARTSTIMYQCMAKIAIRLDPTK